MLEIDLELIICTRCERELPSSSFYEDSSKSSGLKSQCKRCVIASSTKYRDKHRVKLSIARNCASDDCSRTAYANSPYCKKHKSLLSVAREPKPLEKVVCPANQGLSHHWICGDAYIAKLFPGFFESHRLSHVGMEWQKCIKCNAEKQVELVVALWEEGGGHEE